MEEKGIKEFKEAVIAVMEISVVLASLLKDGAQVTDITSLFSILYEDKTLREKLEAGFKGISDIPSEIKDLDFKEGSEVMITAMAYIPKIVDALQKKV